MTAPLAERGAGADERPSVSESHPVPVDARVVALEADPTPARGARPRSDEAVQRTERRSAS
ncbi:MAG: hypothetical protein AVDCRST_MAG11-3982 [uncultured Gemmatimonadaceae bacterium]|uniref:Uncharacterized protein n=1 Tax=uncultured Gemmatimonadaceae bacterium TaxID=246130 RepID=A0A6J4MG96_9BACT|nr:MAG: hypothetical protein AVDCRST_MAG11-3982 [uncultured Gemmatimonadaceae bacterium]